MKHFMQDQRGEIFNVLSIDRMKICEAHPMRPDPEGCVWVEVWFSGSGEGSYRKFLPASEFLLLRQRQWDWLLEHYCFSVEDFKVE